MLNHQFQSSLLILVRIVCILQILAFIMYLKLDTMTDTALVNYNAYNVLAACLPFINKAHTKQFHSFRHHDIYKLLSYKIRLRLLKGLCGHILFQNDIHNS